MTVDYEVKDNLEMIKPYLEFCRPHIDPPSLRWENRNVLFVQRL